jgi:hypothetical protein
MICCNDVAVLEGTYTQAQQKKPAHVAGEADICGISDSKSPFIRMTAAQQA